MNRIIAAVVFTLASSGLELTLVALGAPFVMLLAVGLVLFATAVLVVSWHPLCIVASVGLYATAVILGIIDFSLLGAILSAI